MRKIKKSKARLPTREEFLQYVPKRAEYSWETNDKGLVSITVPKFTSNFGKSFCTLVKKENTFSANLDRRGSFIWKQCDGKTVKEILDLLTKEFPDEKEIDQRLFLFLQQMYALHYLSFLTFTADVPVGH